MSSRVVVMRGSRVSMVSGSRRPEEMASGERREDVNDVMVRV